MIEIPMIFGMGDTVRVRGGAHTGRVTNVDEEERSYLVHIAGTEIKRWYPEEALEASNMTSPCAVEWIDTNGMRRWEYFAAGDTRSEQSARYWVLNNYNVRQIVRTVTDISSYGDFADKYAKK